MKYHVFWSIADTPSHTINVSSICLVTFFGSLISWLLVKRSIKVKADFDKTIALWALSFIGVIALVVFCLTTFIYPENIDAEVHDLLNSGKTKIVEGKIANFSRSFRSNRYGKVTIERFNVDSVVFCYEDAVLGRFNSFGKTNNGVFRNNLPVKITYIKGEGNEIYNCNWILKIEVADSSSLN